MTGPALRRNVQLAVSGLEKQQRPVLLLLVLHVFLHRSQALNHAQFFLCFQNFAQPSPAPADPRPAPSLASTWLPQPHGFGPCSLGAALPALTTLPSNHLAIPASHCVLSLRFDSQSISIDTGVGKLFL